MLKYLIKNFIAPHFCNIRRCEPNGQRDGPDAAIY